MPTPDGETLANLVKLGRLAKATKDSLLSRELTAIQFQPTGLFPGHVGLQLAWCTSTSARLRQEALLSWVDGFADYLATRTYLTDSGFKTLTTLVGAPTAWQAIPGVDVRVLLEKTGIETAVAVDLDALARSSGFHDFCGTAAGQALVSPEVLRRQFEQGEIAEAEGDSEREDANVVVERDEDEAAIHVSLRKFDQSFVERTARRLGINPLLVGISIAEGVEEGWNNSGLVEYCTDVASSYVLDLLSGGGIIPFCPVTPGGETLSSLLRKRFATDGVGHQIEREFQSIVGASLEDWLLRAFFKRHVSQFKKRPVAWQIESLPAQSNGKRHGRWVKRIPAFSCLVHCGWVDADLLPKLRTQYVGPLRTSLQTELRSLEGINKRSPDQDARRLELEGKLEELKIFDARLDGVIVEGFSSPALDMITAKEPLDKWTSRDGRVQTPQTREAFLAQERRYDPDLNDGVRLNIAPLQRASLLAADVVSAKDVEKAITDRAEWRADERRWCREEKLPQPGWWPKSEQPAVASQKKGGR